MRGSGCYGRPYIADERPRVAEIVEGDAWHGLIEAPAIDELSAEQRRALAEFWTNAARSEHSSVAGFHRFALDLLAHGAPAKLVARAQKAAIEEVEHAQACFAIASAYAGRPLSPGRMALGTSAPIASSLAELATWTVHEGCVGETIAAWMASEIAEHSREPAVRAAMQKIAREETEHAELAWATIAWAREVGGEEVHRAIEAAFAVMNASAPVHGKLPCPAHGLLPDAEVEAAFRRAFDELVRPCAERFVAAA